MNIYKSICKIIGIEIDKTKLFVLIKSDKSKYLYTLKNIEVILKKGELLGQAKVVENLIQEFNNRRLPNFYR